MIPKHIKEINLVELNTNLDWIQFAPLEFIQEPAELYWGYPNAIPRHELAYIIGVVPAKEESEKQLLCARKIHEQGIRKQDRFAIKNKYIKDYKTIDTNLGKVVGIEQAGLPRFKYNSIHHSILGKLFDRSLVKFKAEIRYPDSVGYTDSPTQKVGYILGVNELDELVFTRKLYHEGIFMENAKRIPLNLETYLRVLELSESSKPYTRFEIPR